MGHNEKNDSKTFFEGMDKLDAASLSTSAAVPGYAINFGERPGMKVKIKGDAGTYEIWAIDWLYQKVLVCRACGDEWVQMDKLTIMA